MSDPAFDSGSILREQSAQLGQRIEGIKRAITVQQSNIKIWENEIEKVAIAKEIMDAAIDKFPKPKADNKAAPAV